MEVLFKDSLFVYCIENNIMRQYPRHQYSIDYFNNIPHLDDAKILYHYRYTKSGERYPVYYEHKEIFITKISYSYTTFIITNNYIKDYTLINLKLLTEK